MNTDFQIKDYPDDPEPVKFPLTPILEDVPLSDESVGGSEPFPQPTGAKKKASTLDAQQKGAYDYHMTFLANMENHINEENSLADRMLDTRTKDTTTLAFQVYAARRFGEIDSQLSLATANLSLLYKQVGELSINVAQTRQEDPLANKNWDAMFNVLRSINAGLTMLHVTTQAQPEKLAAHKAPVTVQDSRTVEEELPAEGIISRAEFNNLPLDAKKGYSACYGRVFREGGDIVPPKDPKGLECQLERRADHTAPKAPSYVTTLSSVTKVDSVDAIKKRLAVYAAKGIDIDDVLSLKDALRSLGTSYFSQLRKWIEARPQAERWTDALRMLHKETSALPPAISSMIKGYTERESLILLTEAIQKTIA